MELSLPVSIFSLIAATLVIASLSIRSRIGSVPGYLLTGVAIGPHGLDLVAETAWSGELAELGVIMMLFVIGLDLNTGHLWKLRMVIFGMGSMQFLVTAILTGTILALAGTGMAGAFLIGAILALSSTAIGLQNLSENRQLKSPAGRSAVAVLLFQDLAVFPLLVLIPLLQAGGGDAGMPPVTEVENTILSLPGWQQTILIGSTMVMVVFGTSRLARLLFRWIGGDGMRELRVGLSLGIVIGATLLMDLIALSPGIGAFLAGVALADSEYRNELESNIEPFKGLFLTFFFITVGIGFDLSSVLEDPLVILGLAVALVLLKALVLLGIGLAFGLRLSGSILFASILAQGGEFAFLLFNFAHNHGVLDEVTTRTGIAVTVTSMVANPLLLLACRLAGRHLLGDGENGSRSGHAGPMENDLILLGFGRVGQTIARFLGTRGIRPVILDNDPDHVAVMRRHGYQVFYGDAANMNLLRSAGADRARLVIVAISSVEDNIRAVQMIREAFPDLKVICRCRDMLHAIELRKLGVDFFRQEVFDGSVRIGQAVLEKTVCSASEARRTAALFTRFEEERLSGTLDTLESSGKPFAVQRSSFAEFEEFLRRHGKDGTEGDNRRQPENGEPSGGEPSGGEPDMLQKRGS